MPRPDPLRVWARIAPYQQCKHYEGNGAHRVVEPRFLQRPAQPDVADVAARALWHPVIGPDGQIVAGDTLIGHWLILLSSTLSPRSYRARITMLEPRHRLLLYSRLRRYNRRARLKRSSACRMSSWITASSTSPTGRAPTRSTVTCWARSWSGERTAVGRTDSETNNSTCMAPAFPPFRSRSSPYNRATAICASSGRGLSTRLGSTWNVTA